MPSLNYSEVATITVNNVNQAPLLNSIGNKTVAEGSLLEFSVSAYDPDGDAVTLSVSEDVISWATFNTSTGVFRGTPGYGDAGSYNVTFTASDGSLIDSEAITIAVPSIELLPSTGSIQGKITLQGKTDFAGIDVFVPGTSFIAKTDSLGNFVILFIPEGTYAVRAEKLGFQAHQIENVRVVSTQATDLSQIILSPTVTVGSVSGKAFLLNQSNHQGIQLKIAGVTTSTSSDGSYLVNNVPVGSHTLEVAEVTFGNALEKSTVKGTIVFADNRPDNSGTRIAFQLAPNAYIPQSISNVAVFENQTTVLESVTLLLGSPIRIETTSSSDGSFSFQNVPAGYFTGKLPDQPDTDVGVYTQQVGTYSIGATDGEIGTYTDGRIDTMRSTSFTFRNDPNFQDSRPLVTYQGNTTDIGVLTLYPSFEVSTDEFCLSQTWDDNCIIRINRGGDFSSNSSVLSTDTNADIIFLESNQVSIWPIRTAIFGNSEAVIQSLGITDLQNVTQAPFTGYASQASVTFDVTQPWESLPGYQVYTVVTKEGNFAKYKLLLASTGGSLISTWVTFRVLNFYQSNGSNLFDH